MKKYVLWPLLAAIGGVGAFLLRLLQRSTGFEVDTGLPIPGNLYAILLVAWFVVLAAVCLLAARPLLPADREDPPLFPTGFSVASPGLLTPAVMGLFLLAASGVLDLLFCFPLCLPAASGRRAGRASPFRVLCCWCPSAAWWCGWC